MRSKLVDVIIPVFNGGKYLRRALESVYRQTIQDFEIMVIDDGSTDDTPEHIRSLRKKMEFEWISQGHSGPAKARNHGIELANGKYIAFLDCDDEWLPQKLEKQVSLAESNPDNGAAHCDYEIVDCDEKVLDTIHARYSRDVFMQAFTAGHQALLSTLLVRRDLLIKMGGFNASLYYGSEDSDLVIRLYRITGFICIEETLVRKLMHNSDRDNKLDYQNILASRERFLESLETLKPITEAERRALKREWSSYFLERGRFELDRGQWHDARNFYWRAVKKTPFRLRPYTRLLRAWM